MLILFLLLSFLLQFSSVSACRYTVREIGFTDIGSEPYTLSLVVDYSTPEEMKSVFEKMSYAVLGHSNIEFNIVSKDSIDFPSAVPAFILSDSERRRMEVPFELLEDDYKASIWEVLEYVAGSTLRDKIIERSINVFGHVLLIESEDEARNNEAVEVIQSVFRGIGGRLEKMAKPFKVKPDLVRLAPGEFSGEKVLLWGLNVNVEIPAKLPAAVVLYGRGRKIGPVLYYDKIEPRTLTHILSTIGADCECGLDRSWMLDRIIPGKWDVDVRNRYAGKLGFDPDNPLVKTEISRILSKSLAGKKALSERSEPLRNSVKISLTLVVCVFVVGFILFLRRKK